jgi:hypothetical protein
MKNLLAAFFKAQQEFPAPVKDAVNPAYKSRYATLGAVQDAAFPTLWKYGLLALQSARTEVTDHGLLVYVATTLYHVESGESMTQEMGVPPVKVDPQGVGSALSYLKRYSLMTALGLVADDDDDGNAASSQSAPNRTGGPQNRTNVPQGANPQPAAAKPNSAPPAQPQGVQDVPPNSPRATLHLEGVRRYGTQAEWERQQPAVAQWASRNRTDKIASLNDPEIERVLAGWARKDARAKQPEQPESVIHY